MAKRLMKEAQDLAENKLEYASAEPMEGDLFRWKADVLATDDSPFAGGVFTLSIALPADYPYRAPDVRFETKVYHPSVNTSTGEICADLLRDQWKPTLTLRWVLGVIHSMLQDPRVESPLEPEIAAQLRDNPAAFRKTAQEWVKKYAS